jgi:hypothetical protein
MRRVEGRERPMALKYAFLDGVIPAEAGIYTGSRWIPAFAGMTTKPTAA